mgnify:CR=1 FL=1
MVKYNAKVRLILKEVRKFNKYAKDNIFTVELHPKFSYHDLNYLKKISPEKILSKEDRDELYQW